MKFHLLNEIEGGENFLIHEFVLFEEGENHRGIGEEDCENDKDLVEVEYIHSDFSAQPVLLADDVSLADSAVWFHH